jgi:hypothetical protein
MIILSAMAVSWFAPPRGDERNLKVLPANISSDSLQMVMDEFTTSLNVNCAFCHAPKDPQQPTKLNYASDSNHLKEVTRTMLRMTNEMNNKYLVSLRANNVQLVTCNTCHRGKPKPAIK